MMIESAQNYLGIDWGSAGVGVALAHQETGVAMAYTTLPNDENLLKKLGDIIALEEIGTVVVGIPSYINDKNVIYGGADLGRKIEELFPVVVAYQNEMFTTKMAQANLIERGMKQVSLHDDEEAARIILQEWLSKKEL